MPAEGRRLVVALALALAAGGCGGGPPPVRIGVLADCRGHFGGFDEVMLAGAELPLLHRGGHLRGAEPSDGIEHASIAGRAVELVTGCSELGDFGVLVGATRRLVELEHVDVVVGGFGGSDGLVMRELARRHPDVPFIVAGSTRREITLVRPVPNLFRFEPDDAQSAAGLGAYAYRRLGWRRAAIVADDGATGWAQAAAFASEFCARGGRIVARSWLSPFRPTATRSSVTSADGVAALLSSSSPPSALRAVARRVGDPARRLVVGPWITQDPSFRAAVGKAVIGATTSSSIPLLLPTPEARRFEREYHRSFPALPPSFADGVLTHAYDQAVEAAARGVAAVEADLGPARVRLRRALGRIVLDVPGGRIALDHNGQAVARTVLLRLVRAPGTRVPALRPLGAGQPVDQSLGGALTARQVGAQTRTCRRLPPRPRTSATRSSVPRSR